MFAGISFRHSLCVLLTLSATLFAASSQAGWWGNPYGCVYLTDPDYLPRRAVPRPYYIDKDTIWSGDSICHLKQVSDGNYGLSGLAGVYEADCKYEWNSERRNLSVQIVEYPNGDLSLLLKPLPSSDDARTTSVGPLRRCDWGTGARRQ